MKFPEFKDLIIFEDQDFIIVNKPPFLSTLEDRTSAFAPNLLKMARQYHDDAQVCHRLDKETSGALAIAKNNEAYRHLSMQFEHREVSKIYHAVVCGNHRFENEKVDRSIELTGKGSVKLSRSGKYAETYFNTLENYSKHTLVECKPVTGRMHQIRIHLAHLGAPIVGDTLYGGKTVYLSNLKKGFKIGKYEDEQPIIKRFALHAFNLGFKLISGESINIEAPYPKDLAVLIKQLRNFS